ncbi:MAG: Abi family protein [Clostridiales bacterium]|nr:Abi family protein [Clostridiales bacterium]
MQEKPFKTHDELIELLERRGIDFSSPESKSFTKKKLQRIGYYNLINGYSSLFWDSESIDTYKEGTTVEEIYNLYIFDKKLREIFLRNILSVETNIKSLIAYYFPQEHPENQYLTYGNFDTNRRGAS